MQLTLPVAAFAGLVSAGVLQPRLPSGCCTQLTVSGGVSGSLGQFTDGQNRVGPGYGGATYCLNGGGFTDQSNRGCILTPPTTQFQCDVGARPTTGFAIGTAGQVTSGGSSTFYACPATNNGVYNIYTRPVAGQAKCVQVQLKAANAQCYAAPQRYSNSTSSARPVAPSTPSRSTSTSVSTRPASSSASARPAIPSTASAVPSSSSSAPRPAAPPSSPVATANTPVTVTKTVTANAPAAVTQTVTATVCPVQAPIQAGQSTSPRPAAAPTSTSAPNAPAVASTTPRPASPSTSSRPATPSTSPLPVTPSTSPRPVTPSTTPRPVTPSTTPRPVVYTNMTRPATSTSSSARPASTCPALLTGNYQFPHLVVPVNSQQSTRAYGNGYNATITPTTSTDFNFDIPQSYAGKSCSLVFYFPTQAQLQTSSFTQSSNGGSIRFQQLSRAVSAATTFQSQPPVSRDLGVRTVAPGNAYTISTGACPASQTVSYALSSLGGYSLSYFQDYNPCPIGLYIITS